MSGLDRAALGALAMVPAQAEAYLTVSEALAAGWVVAECWHDDGMVRGYGRTADEARARLVNKFSQYIARLLNEFNQHIIIRGEE